MKHWPLITSAQVRVRGVVTHSHGVAVSTLIRRCRGGGPLQASGVVTCGWWKEERGCTIHALQNFSRLVRWGCIPPRTDLRPIGQPQRAPRLAVESTSRCLTIHRAFSFSLCLSHAQPHAHILDSPQPSTSSKPPMSSFWQCGNGSLPAYQGSSFAADRNQCIRDVAAGCAAGTITGALTGHGICSVTLKQPAFCAGTGLTAGAAIGGWNGTKVSSAAGPFDTDR